jgi:Zn-dependent protease with chaperone function
MARFKFSFLAFVFLGACAGLQTKPPEITLQSARPTQIMMQRDAITTQIARTKSVLELSWPLLKSNKDLCGKKIQRSFGWRLLDADIAVPFIQGLRAQDIKAAGFTDEARVVLVITGSPAEKAGIQAEDQLESIDTRKLETATGVKKIGALIIKAIKQHKSGTLIPLEIRRGKQLIAINMKPETICSFPVVLSRASAVNASTNGKSITINQGLLRTEPDVRKIQFVIAHELAHAILRHPQKSARNSIISGGAVLGALAGTAGWIADQGASIIGKKPTVPYQVHGTALAGYPWGKDFEREADYVGLYLLARSGVDLSGVEDLFATFARESPTGTWLGLTHPESANRKLAALATISEINAKTLAGKPLLPEGWPVLPIPKQVEQKNADTN